MTNPTIDPISYNAGIEAAAKIVGEAYEEYQSRLGDDDVIDRGYLLTALASAEVRIGKLHLPEPQTAPDNMFARMADEKPAVLPAEVSEQVNFRTASEIEHARLAGKSPADAERLALAERIEKHVNVMANTSMHLSLEQWGDIANDLLTASAALRAGGWREDMENAPRDGTEFLACNIGYQPFSCRFWQGTFFHFDPDDGPIQYPFTRWQPLPSAPKNTDKEG